MKRSVLYVLMLVLVFMAGCSKPLVSAHIAADSPGVERDYAALPNDVYYAARWALVNAGIPVANENLQEGVITSTWIPVSSGSHYIDLFDRKDWGVTNSYYQLEIRIIPGEGRTSVKVLTRPKTIVSNLKSSGAKENEVLSAIGNSLRKNAPEITNLGVSE